MAQVNAGSAVVLRCACVGLCELCVEKLFSFTWSSFGITPRSSCMDGNNRHTHLGNTSPPSVPTLPAHYHTTTCKNRSDLFPRLMSTTGWWHNKGTNMPTSTSSSVGLAGSAGWAGSGSSTWASDAPLWATSEFFLGQVLARQGKLSFFHLHGDFKTV